MRKFFNPFRLLFATTIIMLFCGISLNARTMKDPIATLVTVLEGKKPNKEKFIDPAKTARDAEKLWDDDARKRIDAALDVDEVDAALVYTRKDSAEYNLGIQKRNAMLRADLEKAVSLQEMLAVAKKAPEGSELEAMVINRVDEYCIKLVEESNTLETLLATPRRPGSPAHMLWMEKMRSLSNQAIRDAGTLEQAWFAYQVGAKDETAQKLWLEVWDALSLKEVRAAKTLEEIRAAYARAQKGSTAQQEAVLKAAKFLPEKDDKK